MPAFLCVCPLIDDKVHHSIVTVADDPLGSACGSSLSQMIIVWWNLSSARGYKKQFMTILLF